MSKGGDTSVFFPKTAKRIVILCDGPPPPPFLLEYWLRGADLFLCTDHAGYPYTHLPHEPDVVIGDFDTLSNDFMDGREGPIFLEVDEQQTTDSEKALLYAAEQDCQEAVLLGATGWLLDHTLHNCALLERFSGRIRICLSDEYSSTLRIGPGESIDWPLIGGTPFSLLPLAGPARGVDVRGGAWSLSDAMLSCGGITAISNRVVAPPLRISLKTGSLLVTIRHAPGPHIDPGNPQ